MNAIKFGRLPDGTLITPADLPPADTMRWTASKKHVVVIALQSGMMTADDLCRRYSLSLAELTEWRIRIERGGRQGLKVTKPFPVKAH